MHITLDVNVRFVDPENTAKLDEILARLRALNQKESSMFEALSGVRVIEEIGRAHV